MTTFEAVPGDAPGGPFTLAMPVGEAIPLVCDSPHSGVHYPADFNAAVPLARLARVLGLASARDMGASKNGCATLSKREKRAAVSRFHH